MPWKNPTSLHTYFAHNILTVDPKQTNIKTLELFNISGKRMFTTDFKDKIIVNSLAQGIYILRCTDTIGATIIKKIVK